MGDFVVQSPLGTPQCATEERTAQTAMAADVEEAKTQDPELWRESSQETLDVVEILTQMRGQLSTLRHALEPLQQPLAEDASSEQGNARGSEEAPAHEHTGDSEEAPANVHAGDSEEAPANAHASPGAT